MAGIVNVYENNGSLGTSLNNGSFMALLLKPPSGTFILKSLYNINILVCEQSAPLLKSMT